MIKAIQIATGKARQEARPPSHDGEYITIYTSDVTSDVIAEHNGGTFCWDDFGHLDYSNPAAEAADLAVREDGDEAIRQGSGSPLTSCGYDATAEMIALGWATAADFDGCTYLRV
jgi:hypothetical protein